VIVQHLGGVPEAAMVLGPVFLIIAFVRIARRNEANLPDDDDEDDWDADLGDLPDPRAHSQGHK
jgi:hypothetical protein